MNTDLSSVSSVCLPQKTRVEISLLSRGLAEGFVEAFCSVVGVDVEAALVVEIAVVEVVLAVAVEVVLVTFLGVFFRGLSDEEAEVC